MEVPDLFADAGQALRIAAAWKLALTELGETNTEELEAWLAETPTHRDAWRQVSQAWAHLDTIAIEPEVMAIRRGLLDPKRRTSRPRSSHGRWIAAAAVILVLTLGVSAHLASRPDATYVTARDARRVVRLTDGTRLTLDAATRLEVRFSKAERAIRLIEGQARFDVAHGPSRPFRVRAGDQTVTALGTSFMVDRSPFLVSVTLLEGQVQVGGRGARAPVQLKPGQRMSAGPAAGADPPAIVPVGGHEATAWEEGRLMFDDEPLVSAVERVSRYTERRIVVADPRTAGLRVSGVFAAGDSETFLEAVTQYFGLQSVSQPNGDIALKAADEKRP